MTAARAVRGKRPARRSQVGGSPAIGCGIDVVEVDRFRRSMRKWGDAFLPRVFTETERSYAGRRRDPALHLAARFAAKEAVVKAVAQVAPEHPLTVGQIEVRNDRLGRPSVRLRSAHGLAGIEIHISLSHSERTAVASAVAVKRVLSRGAAI